MPQKHHKNKVTIVTICSLLFQFNFQTKEFTKQMSHDNELNSKNNIDYCETNEITELLNEANVLLTY